MIASFDAWIELNQAGRLLDRAGLQALPAPGPAPWNMSDQLRDALTAAMAPRGAKNDRQTRSAGRDQESFSALLDVVLEVVCGLTEGWQKGPLVAATAAVKQLDGTELKPRRVQTLADI